mgnify:CR=1 FL=1
MIPDTDAAYIAGLFDGEGSIHIRRGIEKKKKHKGKPGYRYSNSLRLSMEITMTDRSVLMWVHEVLGLLIWPFAHTKLPKIQRVIEHYTQQALKSNVISLDEYRTVQEDVR